MRLSGLSHLAVSKHRIDGLADAVFAIVMTLLVLELKVPELPRHVGSSELLHELAHLGPVFFSFFITFVLAGSYWFLHHVSMHFIHHANQKLCFINLGFLLFVSLLPFSTAMLGRFLSSPVAQSIYFFNQSCIAFMLMLNWRYARSAGLLDQADPADTARLTTHMRGLALGTLAAALLATVAPAQSFYAMFVVIIVNRGLARRLAKRRARAA